MVPDMFITHSVGLLPANSSCQDLFCERVEILLKDVVVELLVQQKGGWLICATLEWLEQQLVLYLQQSLFEETQ